MSNVRYSIAVLQLLLSSQGEVQNHFEVVVSLQYNRKCLGNADIERCSLVFRKAFLLLCICCQYIIFICFHVLTSLYTKLLDTCIFTS